MITKEIITEYCNNFLENTDKFVVKVDVKQNNIIVVYIDSDTSVSIADCRNLSKKLNEKISETIEDFELTVSSYGIGSSLKLIRQYKNHIGDEFSVILNDKSIINGVIISADETSFELQEVKKQKKEEITINHTISYKDVKSTKQIIKFR